jgi:hypothetical protein
MRTVKISEIFGRIEESEQKVIMLLNAEFSTDEKELLKHYGEIYNKEVMFVTMKELLFNKDENILKLR